MSFVEFLASLVSLGIPPLTLRYTPGEKVDFGEQMFDDLLKPVLDGLTRMLLGGEYPNTVYFGLRAPEYNDNIMTWVVSQCGDEACVFWRVFCTPCESERFGCRFEYGGKPRNSTFTSLLESVRVRIQERGYSGTPIAANYPFLIAAHLDLEFPEE